MTSHHAAAASSDSVAIKKEEEEEEEEDDLNQLVKKEEEKKYGDINCNSKEGDKGDDCFANWKVGNWCYVLPSTTNSPKCNDEGTTNRHRQRQRNQQKDTNNHSVISRPEYTKRTTRSRNTTSINSEFTTQRKKKARSSASPPPPSNRNNTDIMQEEDNEDNNKIHDDDDGYESWTEGNWYLVVPTGSSSTSTMVTIRTEQKHSSEISHAHSTKHRNCRKILSYTALHADDPDDSTECDENYSNDDDDSDDEDNNSSNNDDDDDDDDEPKKLRTQKNTMRYTKMQSKRWNEMFQRLVSYKNQHDSTIVSQKFAANSKLGNWVHTQRDNCMNALMSEYRIDHLNSIGFVWNKLDNQWDKMFQRLVTYKKQHHGSTLVPWGYQADPNLVIWARVKAREEMVQNCMCAILFIKKY